LKTTIYLEHDQKWRRMCGLEKWKSHKIGEAKPNVGRATYIHQRELTHIHPRE